MKKIYLLSGAVMLSLAGMAQGQGKAVLKAQKPFNFTAGTERLTNPDTTGLVNTTDFSPIFLPAGGSASYYGYLGGGQLFGNNVDDLNACAQGYINLNGIPVAIEGVLMWFGSKEQDLSSSPTSKVVVKAWKLAPNKATNDNGSGGGAMNSPGPATSLNAPIASADLLFSDIDTVNFNYVAFPSAPQTAGDFAVGVDFFSLAAGDTTGLVCDADGDAANADLAFHNYMNTWYVTDYAFGGLDVNIALWAVVHDATGVNEFFQGMKMTTYPNPASSNSTIEYTLEKDSKNVALYVYDMTGRKVIENKYEEQTAGTYKVKLQTENLASGTYFYQLQANGHNFTKKLVITK
jgi:hypothetical protein